MTHKLGPSATIEKIVEYMDDNYPAIPNSGSWNWVVEVEETFFIFNLDDDYFRIGYELDENEDVKVEPQTFWVEVEELSRWVAKRNTLQVKFGNIPDESDTILTVDMEWFETINSEFNFTLDLAARDNFHVTEKYFTKENSAFENDWEGVGWLSPPWAEAHLQDWVAKAVEQTRNGNAETVVMLLPLRTGSDWFSYVAKHAVEIRPVEASFRRMGDDNVWGIAVEPHALFILKSKSDKALKFDIEAPCSHKAIKLLDEGERRIGAYATVWGELDCDNERMTKMALQESFDSEHTPLMLWMHGLHPEMKSEIPGMWDRSAFKMDAIGLWVEGNIGTDGSGDKAWAMLQEAGTLGLSVGSIWYLVKRAKADDGSVNITDWPLLEISIMEGGKQCVPSAMRSLADKSLEAILRGQATKMEIEWNDSVQVLYTNEQRQYQRQLLLS